ncbi:hypothetical protein FACS1894172_13530 [Spirochaetia bacterium]|nr:hypothetical protein FACS1894164_13360 [Spirochaetia bacterium]GHU33955.1 hypothetical protein FACS1894172_13530 [Spirochaetia bacterium]
MIKAIFLKTDKQLLSITNEIFDFYNVKEISEGDSSFYINNKYYFGIIKQKIKIKISLNNYGYEDLFNIYISLTIDGDEENNFAENFCKILSNHLKLNIAMENDIIINTIHENLLIYFYPDNNK